MHMSKSLCLLMKFWTSAVSFWSCAFPDCPPGVPSCFPCWPQATPPITNKTMNPAAPIRMCLGCFIMRTSC